MWKSVKQLENKNGILYFDGANTVELAREFGTPLYVYSKNRIRDNYNRLINAYKKYYPKFKIYYAIKANNNINIIRVMKEFGAGVDASCPDEIRFAEKAGLSKDDILYSGAYTSDEQLKFAVDHNTKLNLEDPSQLDRLPEVPKFLSFRINPGIGSSGDEGLIFAGPDAKFGVIERDVKKVYEKAKARGVEQFGIHMMTGSNILNPGYFKEVVEKLLDIAGPIAQELNITFDFIDIGGSLGVPYTPEQEELDINSIAEQVTDVLKSKLHEYSMGEPWLIHEPGRYLVCDAGILLAKVESIKNGYKKFIGLDAGMNTLLRPAMYNAYHHILYADDLNTKQDEKVDVAGQVCENPDIFAKDRMLSSKIKLGDILALLNTGAYGYAMSSQYNTRPQPAEVLVDNGITTLIRKRQSSEDLMRDMIL